METQLLFQLASGSHQLQSKTDKSLGIHIYDDRFFLKNILLRNSSVVAKKNNASHSSLRLKGGARVLLSANPTLQLIMRNGTGGTLLCVFTFKGKRSQLPWQTFNSEVVKKKINKVFFFLSSFIKEQTQRSTSSSSVFIPSAPAWEVIFFFVWFVPKLLKTHSRVGLDRLQKRWR